MPSGPGPQLARLNVHFNREPITRERFAAYVAELSDVPDSILEAAVTKLIRVKTDPWFPTVGLIRETCAELALEIPTEHAALAEVDELIKWGRGDSSERSERPPPVHSVVRLALDQVGGTPAFRSSDAPTVIRGQFARIFRELRAERIRNAQIGLALGPGASSDRSSMYPATHGY